MYSDHEARGGANIIPSARPGIHDHARSPFTGEVMGRYGEKRSNHGLQRRPQPMARSSPCNEGRDEVDNVVSKFAQTPSPILTRHCKEVRRNSIDLINPYNTEDDSNDNALAKSLPAYLPSYSREDSDDWHEPTASPNTHNISGQSGSIRNLSHSFNNSLIQEYNHSSQHNNRSYGNSSERRTTESKEKTRFPKLIAVLVGVVGCLATGWQYGATKGSLDANNYNKVMFYKDINELGEKYRINDESMLQIKSGIATISEKQDTASFVFLYKSDTKDFNENTFNNFVNAVASFAARYLRNDSASVHHITVDGSKLQMSTYSDFVREYRDDVTRTGVMLLKDLGEVPSNLAMAFHYYCDEFNPLAKKSAIFFTLDMAKCWNSPRKQQSTHEIIEKCLANKWTDIPDDNIRPLLTRVVNIVVDITDVVVVLEALFYGTGNVLSNLCFN